MIHLFFGPDTYRSREAFRVAREKATARAGSPVVLLRDEALTVSALTNVLEGQSLFGAAPPVAAERLTRFTADAAEAIARELQSLPRQRTLLVWEEGNPNLQGIVWKALQRTADRREESVSLSPRELSQWIRRRVQDAEATIEPAAVERLVALCGADLWRMSAEIDKLTLSHGRGAIRAADVDALVAGAVAADLFAAVRAVAGGEAASALRHLVALQRSGEEPRRLFFLVVREVQHLRAVRARLDHGERLAWWDVARSLRLPRDAADHLLASAQQMSSATLRSLFDRLVVSYYHLNSGRADAAEVLETLVLTKAQEKVA